MHSTRSQGWTAPSPAARFLRHFAVATCCTLALIVIANYVINPLGLYPSQLLPPMVWNSAAQKLQLITEATPKPEAVVLGSSRAMQIAPATIKRLTGLSAFNFAVDSARTEDYYVILRRLVEQERLPLRLLIIGVDVEAFHNRVPPNERLLTIPTLTAYLRYGEASRVVRKNLRRLVSLQQTTLSVTSLLRTLHPTSTEGVAHFEADGYLRYVRWERQRSDGSFDLMGNIRASINEYTHRFNGFSALSVQRCAYFRDTLAYARAQHIPTIVYVTPLHPAVIEALLPLGYAARLREVTAYLAQEAHEHGAIFTI
jgi:hypothetical protein